MLSLSLVLMAGVPSAGVHATASSTSNALAELLGVVQAPVTAAGPTRAQPHTATRAGEQQKSGALPQLSLSCLFVAASACDMLSG